MKKFAWLIFLLALVVFVGWVSVRQLNNQKSQTSTEFLTPTLSPQQTEEITTPLFVSEDLVNQQLEIFLPSLGQPAYNGKVFCVHYLYGFDQDQENSLVKAYVWAYCEEYYQENNQIKMGFGVSEPVLVTMQINNGTLAVESYKEPGNGSLYAPSIKEMFPPNYADQAINGYDIGQLSPSPKEQAEKYYTSE